MDQDLIEYLFAYVYGDRMRPYLWSEQYHKNLVVTEKLWQRLLSELTPEQRKHLKTYRDVRETVVYAEQEAIFQAGLSLGLSIGRLS